MTLREFKEAIQTAEKPIHLSQHLEAMFEDALGNWDRAHEIAQSCNDLYGNLIHAYLHRKEGDQWNAKYWYDKTDRQIPSHSLEQEWEEISEELLTL